ncbi:hypothetical protein HY994_00850 [Candidatus Micrarchaeota archaeon]|nr:hypothetical protein [Candidatus Micrarchaeota archaeon]
MNAVGKIIAAWGIVIALAWGYLHADKINFFGTGFQTSAMIWWTILMVLLVAATYQWFPNARQNKVVHAWTLILAAGLLVNYLNLFDILPATLALYSYYHTWLLLGAIGFAYTAVKWTPKSAPIYWAAAGLNVLLLAYAFLAGNDAFFNANSLLLAGIVQGLPTLVDGVLNYNT